MLHSYVDVRDVPTNALLWGWNLKSTYKDILQQVSLLVGSVFDS